LALNWDDMRVFLAVARGGSLSTAAWALKVTQPTAGPRVRALEAALSARLFDRLPQGLVLTAAGGKLLPLAEAMERQSCQYEQTIAYVDALSRTPDVPNGAPSPAGVATILDIIVDQGKVVDQFQRGRSR